MRQRSGTTSSRVHWMILPLVAAACSSGAGAVAHGPPENRGDGVVVPADVDASYLMYDRAKDRVLVQRNPDKAYRSASVVKILIALDYLYSHGSWSDIPPKDLAALQSMLRSSDDDAANDFWDRAGQIAMVDRMAIKLELQGIRRPANPDFWGHTAFTALDILRIYRYLLDGPNDDFRRFVLDNIGMSTSCATDGRDQYFGIPRAVHPPFRIKQGWSAFGDVPAGRECQPAAPHAERPGVGTTAPPTTEPSPRTAPPPDIDLKSRLLHTTGLVDQDQKILIVLTLHPRTTTWEDAATKITSVTQQVYTAGTRR
ncbi:hypothetical protein LZC95_30500 [Pendulispora brunnea]|uniref:Uncharacterized protein n=1 Tax=Pendulispora brunnea TaxID=2905690 RepID=A0ABZ2K0R7_9BACT